MKKRSGTATKLSNLLALLLVVQLVAHAQTPIKVWDRTIGAAREDGCNLVMATPDNGFLLGGVSVSDAGGDKSENNRGPFYFPDYWAVKIDATGKIEWEKTFGGSATGDGNGNDNLTGLAVASDGGYIIAGMSGSSMGFEKSQNTRGGNDYWIIKTDLNGKVIWDKTYGGSSFDNMAKFRATSDGGYIAGGDSQSDASGEKTENNKGSSYTYDSWIIKLDAKGNLEWEKSYGTFGWDYFSEILQNPDGTYLISINTASDKGADKTEDSKGGMDYWLIKTDSKGKIIWDKTIGGNGHDELISMMPAQEGGYFLVGFSDSPKSGDKSENSKGGLDYWIVRVDADGNILWDKTIGGLADERYPRVAPYGKGGLLVGCATASGIGGDKTEAGKGNLDFWLVALDAKGNLLWDKSYGTSEEESRFDITTSAKGGYLVTGQSRGGVEGDKTEPSKGDFDFWAIRLLDYPDGPLSCPADTTIHLDDGRCSVLVSGMEPNIEGTSIFSGFLYELSGVTKGAGQGPLDKTAFNNGTTEVLYKLAFKPENSCRFKVHVVVNPSPSFSLIDASKDRVIGMLYDDTTINIADVRGKQINIRFNSGCTPVPRSAVLELTGQEHRKQMENNLPFALFGNKGTDYQTWTPTAGNYQLKGTTYLASQGTGMIGNMKEVHFRIVDDLSLSSFTLVDATTNKDLYSLSNGSVVDLAATPKINIRVNPGKGYTESVRFDVNNLLWYRIENSAPFAVAANRPNDYNSWRVAPGNFTITAIPYSLNNAKGKTGSSLTINFRIINSASNKPALKPNEKGYTLGATAQIHGDLFPNPVISNGVLTYTIPQSSATAILLHNSSGSIQRRLFGGNIAGGQQQQLQFSLGDLPPGAYLITITTGNGLSKTIKLMKHSGF